MSHPPSNGIPQTVLAEIDMLRRQRVTLERASIALTVLSFAVAAAAFSLLLDWKLDWTAPPTRTLPPCLVLSTTLLLAWALARPARLQKIQDAESREIDRLLPQAAEPLAQEKGPSKSPTDTSHRPSSDAEETLRLRNRLNAEAVFPKRRFHRAARIFVFILTAAAITAFRTQAPIQTLLQRFLNPLADVPLTTIALDRLPKWVKPGSDVEISATLLGKIPEAAHLRLRDSVGNIREISLPLFGRRVTYPLQNILNPASFRIVAGKATSKWIDITPVEVPAVSDFRLRVFPPSGLRRPPRLYTEWPSSIEAAPGSRIALEFTTRQAVASAHLEQTWEAESRSIPLIEPEPRLFRTTWEVIAPHSFSIQLENVLGQTNPRYVTAVRIQPLPTPEWKDLQPTTDTHFLHGGSWKFDAALTSAESVTRWGLTLQVGRDAEKEIVLGENPASLPILQTSHILNAGTVPARDAETFSWFFWYEQNTPNGQCSRWNGELFFGTVAKEETRPAGSDSDLLELVRLQRESLAELWNFQRKVQASHRGSGIPSNFFAELDKIEEGQKRIQTRATQRLLQFEGRLALRNRLREAEMSLFKALAELKSARKDEAHLDAALRSQRLAYETLHAAWIQNQSLDIDENR